MSLMGLSVPSIQVKNVTIGIVPNSFKYKSGDGEVTVRAASTGGGNATTVHTQDAETMFSTIMFSVYATAEMTSKIRDWKADVGGLTVDAVQKAKSSLDKDFALGFKGVSMTNDPDVNAAVDGVIEIEMAGDKLEQ